MISSHIYKSERLATHYISTEGKSNKTYIFLHDIISSCIFFKPLIEVLGEEYQCIALDLRGFGDSEAKAIDAKEGVSVLTEDVLDLLNGIDIIPSDNLVYIVGWGLGGTIAMDMMLKKPNYFEGVVFINPISPFGLGGSKNTDTTLKVNFPDCAGSGGAIVNLNFLDCIQTEDGELPSNIEEELSCNPEFYARNMMNYYYFFMEENEQSLLDKKVITQALEDELVEEMFKTTLGADFYPGDYTETENWPMIAPGPTGLLNALSPLNTNVSGIIGLPKASEKTPKVLWIRGEEDVIVSDDSYFDLGFVGSLDPETGWPGHKTFPAQPMIKQTRATLKAYADNGGFFKEKVLSKCGHTPHIEQTKKVAELIAEFY